MAASTLARATDPGKQSAGPCKSSSGGLWKRPYLNPELLPSALGGQHVSGTMWLVVSCVVNRNRKVGANSRDPISTSTMQRHRNPNHRIWSIVLHPDKLRHGRIQPLDVGTSRSYRLSSDKSTLEPNVLLRTILWSRVTGMKERLFKSLQLTLASVAARFSEC